MMTEGDEIVDLENRLDWIIGRRPAVKRRNTHRPLKLTEYNMKALFNMTMKEILYALCRKLGYVVVKKESGIEVIR
ncbi:MAG: hypothetical protein E3J35_08685 [Methanomassiliicoccales archaeon]|nr:MAG: hypothetical protein E3J35_08685 [Methanomassiliicoccales archaeon]